MNIDIQLLATYVTTFIAGMFTMIVILMTIKIKKRNDENTLTAYLDKTVTIIANREMEKVKQDIILLENAYKEWKKENDKHG